MPLIVITYDPSVPEYVLRVEFKARRIKDRTQWHRFKIEDYPHELMRMWAYRAAIAIYNGHNNINQQWAIIDFTGPKLKQLTEDDFEEFAF